MPRNDKESNLYNSESGNPMTHHTSINTLKLLNISHKETKICQTHINMIKIVKIQCVTTILMINVENNTIPSPRGLNIGLQGAN